MLIVKYNKILSRFRSKSLLEHIKFKSSSSKENETNTKFSFKLSKNIEKEYLEKKFHAKQHPGIMNVKCVSLPPDLIETITKIKEDAGYPTSTLNNDANSLFSYIWHRQPEPEEDHLRRTLDSATIKLLNKGQLPPDFLEGGKKKNIEDLTESEKRRLRSRLKNLVYNWKPMEFTEYSAFVYLWCRLPAEFASLVQIFHEIKQRRKHFKPTSLFDFGSGVGSVTWAVNEVWSDECSEVYNVDSSSVMNSLSELLTRKGESGTSSPSRHNNTYYRQFLPSSDSLKYDLVVSSRSMLEIGNLKSRIQTADILWKKVSPGGFLVLVEPGNKNGHFVLLEIRDYLLEMNRLEREKYSRDSLIHVFSPCPHDLFCPRFNHRSGVACHFSVLYNSLMKNNAKTELFSYVVLQKRERDDEYEWPRIVQPVLSKHQHIICRTCTPKGSIREVVATKAKHGISCVHLCKASKWGDFLPVDLERDSPPDQHTSNDQVTHDDQHTSNDQVTHDQQQHDPPTNTVDSHPTTEPQISNEKVSKNSSL